MYRSMYWLRYKLRGTFNWYCYKLLQKPFETIVPYRIVTRNEFPACRLLDLSNLFKHNPSCDILTEREHKEVEISRLLEIQKLCQVRT